MYIMYQIRVSCTIFDLVGEGEFVLKGGLPKIFRVCVVTFGGGRVCEKRFLK